MSFFGKNRTTKNTQNFASPDFVKISIGGAGGAQSGLAQQIRAQVQQTLEELYVIGEPSVYFANGPTQGTLDISRYATCGGFLKGITGDSACGFVESIKLNGKKAGAQSCYCGGVSCTFKGAKLQGVNLTIVAGAASITEGATFRVSDIKA